MEFDLEKIAHIYGEDVIETLYEQKEIVLENMEYLYSIGFVNIEDIFERHVFIFLNTPNDFRKKVKSLITSCGEDYIDMLENNMDLWDGIE